MALFGKQDRLEARLEQVRNGGYRDDAELEQLFEELARQPGFHAKKHLWMLGHGDASVRKLAKRNLERSGDPSTIDWIVGEMGGKPASVRGELAGLAVSLGSDRIVRLLGPLLHSRKIEEREVALDLVGAYPRRFEMREALREALKDPVATIRRQAATLVAEGILEPGLFSLLTNLLHDNDDSVRHTAIAGLCQAPIPELIEPFFERLVEEPPQIRALMSNALARLAQHPEARLEERLLPMLADENAALREAAVALLRELPDPKKVLRAWLLHSRGMVPWLKARSQESISRVTDRLLIHLVELMHDENLDVRVGALMMASATRDRVVIPHLRDMLLSDDDWWVRSLAADALANFPSRETVEVLCSQIAEPDLGYALLAALGKTQRQEALRPLFAALGDPRRGLRTAALEALESFDDVEVMEHIFAVAERDPDPRVRDKAQVALERFGESSRPMRDRLERRCDTTTDETPINLEMVNDSLNHRD